MDILDNNSFKMFLKIFFQIGFSLLLFNARLASCQQPPVISNFVNGEIDNHAIELKEGSSYRVSLECNGIGPPEPEYKWYHNNKEIQNEIDESNTEGSGFVGSGRFTANNNEILTIYEPEQSNTLKNHIGYYYCEAKNNFGTAKSEVIYVADKPLPNPNDLGYTIPQFTDGGPKPQVIPYERPATLHCAANGDPTPDIIWTRDGTIIDFRYEVRNRGQIHLDTSTNDLTVNNVKEDTVGTYACNATNMVGYVYKSVRLNILRQSPHFVERPMNKNLSTGMKGIFRCSVGGYPEPTISWMHKGVDIDTNNNIISPNNKYELNSEGGLIINSISKEDEGSLTCSADNTEGTISGKYA